MVSRISSSMMAKESDLTSDVEVVNNRLVLSYRLSFLVSKNGSNKRPTSGRWEDGVRRSV